MRPSTVLSVFALALSAAVCYQVNQPAPRSTVAYESTGGFDSYLNGAMGFAQHQGIGGYMSLTGEDTQRLCTHTVRPGESYTVTAHPTCDDAQPDASYTTHAASDGPAFPRPPIVADNGIPGLPDELKLSPDDQARVDSTPAPLSAIAVTNCGMALALFIQLDADHLFRADPRQSDMFTNIKGKMVQSAAPPMEWKVAYALAEKAVLTSHVVTPCTEGPQI